MKILVTGAAGFIGADVCLSLINRGYEVVGVDNINDYYDPSLKQARLKKLLSSPNAFLFTFIKIGVEERDKMAALFETHQFNKVVHLAAQAGVRYSLENPNAYVDSNLVGFVNILEGCRHNNVAHLVYASSSSVYGANKIMPFSEQHNVDHQVSLYAASKKANELMAHTYSHLYGLPTTGLRFFTVYGPWGRPDMALFKFTKAILAGETIKVYNYGNHRRDFTYIDDIVDGVMRSLDRVASPNEKWDASNPEPSSSKAPYKVYNIGAQTPVHLLRFVETLEDTIGVEAKKEFLPIQPGDLPDTYADVSALINDTGYQPRTNIRDGIKAFVKWYRDFYEV